MVLSLILIITMDFVKSFFNRPHYKDHIPTRIYGALDWKRTLVGGSYALQQYTGDHWKPNDIDIFVKCKDEADFNKTIDDFTSKVSVNNINKYKDYSDNQDQNFNPNIVGVASISIDELNTKIQLVGINTGDDKSLFNKVNEITDKPACLTYRMENNIRTFHGTEQCFRVVNTRKIPRNPKQLVSRMEKYRSRGFTFE